VELVLNEISLPDLFLMITLFACQQTGTKKNKDISTLGHKALQKFSIFLELLIEWMAQKVNGRLVMIISAVTN
jgi:hypothetical protein